MVMSGLILAKIAILVILVMVVVRDVNRRGRRGGAFVLAVILAVTVYALYRLSDRQPSFVHVHHRQARADRGYAFAAEPVPPPVARQIPVAEAVTAQPAEAAAASAAFARGTAELPAPVAGLGVPVRVSTERPAWIRTAAGPTADGAYQVAVTTDPYVPSDPAAQQALARELARAVAEYIDLVGAELGESQASSRVALPLEYIQARLIADTWQEPYRSQTESIGEMVRLNALLTFDADDQRDIRRRCREAVVRQRLFHAGTYGGLALVVLSAVFGYLKLDTATRGFYSGRLKAAAGLVIAAALATGALLAAGKIAF
jgi:hypothetical protein